MHTNTKENTEKKCSKEGVESFPLEIESMNNYIKYIELRICFVTVSSQPICIAWYPSINNLTYTVIVYCLFMLKFP